MFANDKQKNSEKLKSYSISPNAFERLSGNEEVVLRMRYGVAAQPNDVLVSKLANAGQKTQLLEMEKEIRDRFVQRK